MIDEMLVHTPEEGREVVRNLIAENPLLHDWGGGLQSGGIGGEIASTISAYLLDEFGYGNFRSIETGAGLSTLVFLGCNPQWHFSITPDEDLKERLEDAAEARNLPTENWRHEVNFSELVVPGLALAEQATVDIAMIDGGHGWPTVFVDFCYLNMMLRKGGIMIVDDIQAFPCSQLYMLLKHQPGWKLEQVVWGKTAFFRKETDAKLMPDFGGQPYLTNNMLFR